MVIQIDLSNSFEKAKKLFSGLADISGHCKEDVLSYAVKEKCSKICELITEVRELLKASTENLTTSPTKQQ